MAQGSGEKFSGFFRRSVDERVRLVADEVGLEVERLQHALKDGGLDAAHADKLVENVLGTYALPFSVVVHLLINGRRRIAPMVVEEPSVVAAASGAAKLIAQGGGFWAEADEPVMISQVQLYDVPDLQAAKVAIEQAETELLSLANSITPSLVARGGGARRIEVRPLEGAMLVVHLLIDCRDAMGANLVNTVAEALGPRIAELARGRLGLRILSNLADHRCVRVRCRVPAQVLAAGELDGLQVAEAIEGASRFAEADPYRAATHNKGIMNGVDPVILATGNDWRAVEAGAHAFASLSGKYRPLATWRKHGVTQEDAALEGQLEMPLAVGTVGGTSGPHRAAQLALRLAGIQKASDLAMLAACVGLASNLAALKALATEGIQRGHMSLHARSVALAVGATGDEVERVAAEMSRTREITRQAAEQVLRRIRAARENA